MILNRYSVLGLGILLIVLTTFTGQIITYMRSEVARGIVDGHKDGKSFVKFDTENGPVRVLMQLPPYYITGNDARVIYLSDDPAGAVFYSRNYWENKQVVPIMVLIFWCAFSLAYITGKHVLIISFKKGTFGRVHRDEAFNFYNDNKRLP